jgi:hypothetical protein
MTLSHRTRLIGYGLKNGVVSDLTGNANSFVTYSGPIPFSEADSFSEIILNQIISEVLFRQLDVSRAKWIRCDDAPFIPDWSYSSPYASSFDFSLDFCSPIMETKHPHAGPERYVDSLLKKDVEQQVVLPRNWTSFCCGFSSELIIELRLKSGQTWVGSHSKLKFVRDKPFEELTLNELQQRIYKNSSPIEVKAIEAKSDDFFRDATAQSSSPLQPLNSSNTPKKGKVAATSQSGQSNANILPGVVRFDITPGNWKSKGLDQLGQGNLDRVKSRLLDRSTGRTTLADFTGVHPSWLNTKIPQNFKYKPDVNGWQFPREFRTDDLGQFVPQR